MVVALPRPFWEVHILPSRPVEALPCTKLKVQGGGEDSWDWWGNLEADLGSSRSHRGRSNLRFSELSPLFLLRQRQLLDPGPKLREDVRQRDLPTEEEAESRAERRCSLGSREPGRSRGTGAGAPRRGLPGPAGPAVPARARRCRLLLQFRLGHGGPGWRPRYLPRGPGGRLSFRETDHGRRPRVANPRPRTRLQHRPSDSGHRRPRGPLRLQSGGDRSLRGRRGLSQVLRHGAELKPGFPPPQSGCRRRSSDG